MQKRAREEILNTISDFEHFNMEELNNLVYIDAFIKESLRLFIPAPHSGRVAKRDCKLGDVLIPKGTKLVMSNLYIHRNEFGKGDEFIPERWLNGMIAMITKY